MDESQTTHGSLIIRLEDGNDKQAWSDFIDLYSPVIYGFARRQGLQDADAADLVQEVLRSVARSIPKYDRQKGRFRNWLMAVVRHRLNDFWVSHGRQPAGSGDTRVQDHLEQVCSPDGSDKLWEQEYQRSVFQLAVNRIRDSFEDSTWQAFWRTSVESEGIREVAQSLEMSEGAVYIARSRVLARLKQQVQAFEE
ncbi:MAG: sigma-70 family RNA polymerase sigma factor [Planctomycetaceae bacterium]|nr:sigma-70 family RNA polymerase sigma factor [Planctomycetaceae bacterium]